jgi:hypothetical protein
MMETIKKISEGLTEKEQEEWISLTLSRITDRLGDAVKDGDEVLVLGLVYELQEDLQALALGHAQEFLRRQARPIKTDNYFEQLHEGYTKAVKIHQDIVREVADDIRRWR